MIKAPRFSGGFSSCGGQTYRLAKCYAHASRHFVDRHKLLLWPFPLRKKPLHVGEAFVVAGARLELTSRQLCRDMSPTN